MKGRTDGWCAGWRCFAAPPKNYFISSYDKSIDRKCLIHYVNVSDDLDSNSRFEAILFFEFYHAVIVSDDGASAGAGLLLFIKFNCRKSDAFISFVEAQAKCESMQGHLVEIDSRKEFRYLKRIGNFDRFR